MLLDGLDRAEAEEVLRREGAGDRPGGGESSLWPPALPFRFGDYELLEEIAHGGMGVVWKARQLSLNRLVAVKMLLAGPFATPQLAQRFRVEAESAAGLQHPNIVAIHEVGEHDGHLFFSMDYVRGRDLADLVRQKPLSARQAASYLARLADAVQYAHEHGILHRDLKPSNILIDESDQPRLTDFGLAKRLAEDPDLTVAGQMVGSPNYVSPEQARGRPEEIGPASDVYSLGAILYHLLTGRPPFQAGSLTDLLHQVTRVEVVSPRLLNPDVPRDLETICLKCLQKEADRRYGSARVLAEELDRFLRGAPILARPVSRMEKSWRWAGRNRLVAALTALAVLLLVSISLGSLVAAVWLKRAERLATSRLQQALVAQAQAGRWSERAGRRFDSLEALSQAAQLGHRLGLTESGRLTLRNEVIACLALADLHMVKSWSGLPEPNDTPCFDEALEHYYEDDGQGRMVLRRISDGAALSWLEAAGGRSLARCLSSDGRRLAVKYQSGTVRVWNLERRQVEFELASRYSPVLGMSEDNEWLALDQPDGSMLALHLPSQTRHVLPMGEHEVRWAVFAHHTSQLALSCPDGRWLLRLWDLDREEWFDLTPPGGAPRGVAWRADDSLLAVACQDDRTHLWDARRRQWRNALQDLSAKMNRLTFPPHGRSLLTWGRDGATRLWDPDNGRLLLSIPGMHFLQFSRDGRRLAFRSGLRLGLWEVDEALESRLLAGMPVVDETLGFNSVSFSPKQPLVAASCRQGVRLWHPDSGRQLAFLPYPDCNGAVFGPRSGDLYVSGSQGVLQWPCQEVNGSEGLALDLGPPRWVHRPVVPSAKMMVFSEHESVMLVKSWDMTQAQAVARESGKVLATLKRFQMHGVSLSRDGRWAAAGNWLNQGATVWELPSGRLAAELPTTGSAVAEFSPDGHWLITSTGEDYQFWRVGTWQAGLSIQREGGGDYPGVLAFSNRGRLLAVASSRQLVKLLDLDSGRELATLDPSTLEQVLSLQFSPDDRYLAVAAGSPGVRLWDLRQIRARLAEMELDWDGPSWATLSAGPAFDPGDFTLRTRAPSFVPARPADVPAALVDLSHAYNAGLDEGWHSGGRSSVNNLAALPAGRRSLAGIEFDVRGIVQLNGASLPAQPDAYFPDSVGGLRVGMKCRRLHFLHGTGWSEDAGTRLGTYHVRFEDGRRMELPVVYGVHVSNWTVDQQPDPTLAQADLAWCTQVGPQRFQCLYRMTWTNPRPDVPVRSIEFHAHQTRSAPFLIAITAE